MALYFYPVCGTIKHRASPKNRMYDKVLKKKKIMSVILAASLMMSLSSCGSSSSIGDEKSSASQSTSDRSSSKSKENAKPTKLTNKMSDYEKGMSKNAVSRCSTRTCPSLT